MIWPTNQIGIIAVAVKTNISQNQKWKKKPYLLKQGTDNKYLIGIENGTPPKKTKTNINKWIKIQEKIVNPIFAECHWIS